MKRKKNISKTGYKKNSPHKNRSYNTIPSGRITMKDVPHPVLGVDEFGNQQVMMPGGEYQFKGSQVTEFPLPQNFNTFETMNNLNQGGVPMGYHVMPDGTIMSDQEMMMYGGAKGYMQQGGTTKSRNFEGTQYVENTAPTVLDARNPNAPLNVEYNEPVYLPKFENKSFHTGTKGTGKFDPETGQEYEEAYFTFGDRMRNLFMPNKDRIVPSFQVGGPIPSIKQGQIINSFMPTMQMGGDPTKEFLKMAKTQFKGSTAPQNFDTEKYNEQNNENMMNYLSNNLMRNLAIEEAKNMGQFMQMGGEFGFNPNMYNQNQFAMAAQSNVNGALGGFLNQGVNTFQNANPFYQMQIKQLGGVVTGGRPTPLTPEEQAILNETLGTGNPDDFTDPFTYPEPKDDPAANMEYLKNKYASEGITDEQGNVFSAKDLVAPVPTRQNKSVPSYSQNQTTTNTPPPGYQPTYTNNVPTGPRVGNYQGNPNPVVNQQQPYYVQGQNMNPMQGHIPAQSPYGFFPMNTSPHFKLKGSNQFYSGVPGINFDPSNTYLKDYEYKSRLFGAGPRKIKMTFGHNPNGMVSNQPQFGEQGYTGGSPNVAREEYIERHVDPTLLSKMQHGDASEEEIAAFNKQYQEQGARFDNRRVGPNQGISPDLPVSFGTKLRNFGQELSSRRKTRKNQKDNGFQTAVHPSYLQLGGPMNVGNANAYGNPDQMADETTLVWKRKMGVDPENAVAWGLSGLDALSSIAEAGDARKNKELMQQRMFGDALFQPVQAGAASRGDYDPNSGMFRPHMQVPVQFSGMNAGQIGSPATFKSGGEYQEGGEYYLDDAEIERIKKMGGSIEFID